MNKELRRSRRFLGGDFISQNPDHTAAASDRRSASGRPLRRWSVADLIARAAAAAPRAAAPRADNLGRC